MKATIKTSRAVSQLEKMFSVLNNELFDGELDTPIITIQSSPRSYGHSTVKKVWKQSDGTTRYEINISAEYINLEIECTLDTLIHEMIHQYCRIKGIKETSRNGHYHNNEFKKLAEEKGLKVFKCGNAGWNTDHHGNDKLTEIAIKHEWYDIEIGRNTITFKSSEQNPQNESEQTHATSSTIKYHCPKCNTKIRATRNLDGLLKCIPCDCEFIRT